MATIDAPQRQHVVDASVVPIWVGEVDLDATYDGPAGLGTNAPDLSRYGFARVLVRRRGEPVGLVGLDLADMASSPGTRWLHALRVHATDRAVGAETPAPPTDLVALATADLPGLSVVIGTRNRPEHLHQCVTDVLAVLYPGPIEVIVVDNGASTSATADVVAEHFGADDRVRYVAETRPGLSKARNIGLRLASQPWVAFLSDDIRVDPLWALAIARGFRRADSVRAVFGYCPPYYLDSAAQQDFETLMGWGWRNGFAPTLLGPTDPGDALHPYRLGWGIGANMAFDTGWFREQGGFDERLGPGTRTRGGEDLAAAVAPLLDGRAAAYEPAVLGWHADRYDDRTFDSLMYTYGLGLTAFLTSHLVRPATAFSVIRRIPHGLGALFAPADLPVGDPALLPRRISRRARLSLIAGRLAGPWTFLRSLFTTTPPTRSRR
ncbi:MAG: glycosyltransferase family A protein [Actinomycetota bacterium]